MFNILLTIAKIISVFVMVIRLRLRQRVDNQIGVLLTHLVSPKRSRKTLAGYRLSFWLGRLRVRTIALQAIDVQFKSGSSHSF